MATNPYTSQSISNYNSSPPADDGTQVASNQLTWAKHKTKLADPIKTLAEAVDTAVSTAFAKVINTDADENNAMAGSLAFTKSELTIATGATVTPTRNFHTISPEVATATDTVSTLATTGVSDGCVLRLLANDITDTLTLSHTDATSTATTNVSLFGSADKVLSPYFPVTLMLNGGKWYESDVDTDTNTGLLNVVEDTTPQLGGFLDTNSKFVSLSQGAAVASVAGDTDIWANFDGNTVHITGTNAITDFGTPKQAGDYMWVVFDGAASVVDSATITVDGNANFQAAANDLALVYALTTSTFLFKPLPNSGALFTNVDRTLAAGFGGTDDADGTKSSGTYTPTYVGGNFKTATNGGAHTLAPQSGTGTILVQYTNDGSAGAITTSGWTIVTGDAFTTTNADDFMCYLSVVSTFKHLHVVALQ